MKRILIFSIINILLIAVSCNNTETQKNKTIEVEKIITKTSIYDKAGIIKVKDPMASLVGYRKAGEDFFDISLDDVGKYIGNVCAGTASVFLLTKQALKALYPNGEVPVRGQIRVVASASSIHIDVASYITGAKTFYGRQEVNTNDLIIDKSLQGEKGTLTMIFKRKDNGKMVKTVFNKMKLFEPGMMKIIMPLKEKVLTGTATDEEKALFAEKAQIIVEKAITNMPEGVITISECTEYVFPEK